MQENNHNKFINHVFIWIMSFLSFCCLTSCRTVSPQYGTSYDQMHQTLQQSVVVDNTFVRQAKKPYYVPPRVRNALVPAVARNAVNNNDNDNMPERRFDVAADKMPAKAFFMGLVDGTPYNMVVSPKVTGEVSLNLKHVTIDETMQVVHDVYGYEYKRTAVGYEVLPQVMESRIYNVNYLDVLRRGRSITELSTGEITQKIGTITAGNSAPGTSLPVGGSATTTTDLQSGSNVHTLSEMNFWLVLARTLNAMVGTNDGRSVVVNRQAGVVIVHALPAELRQVSRYLERIQSRMNRQVIIEAKILEVQLNDQFQSGINWNAFGQGNVEANQGGASQDSNQIFDHGNFDEFKNIFTLNMGKGNFALIVKLLQTQGNVQVLSSPRISTVNNQKAVFKVGSDEFFVTGVSSQTTVTGNSTTPTQDVNLTPFFSGITLDVTPQISNNGDVVLHIHPSVSEVTTQVKNVTLGQSAPGQNNTLVLPLAKSTIRESDNIVRAKDGQIVVIGGLMQNNMVEEVAGTPGLSRIPFFGFMFRRTLQLARKTELVILLRPVVAEGQAFANDMDQTDAGFQRLKRGFHAGGLPDVFGNEAERAT